MTAEVTGFAKEAKSFASISTKALHRGLQQKGRCQLYAKVFGNPKPTDRMTEKLRLDLKRKMVACDERGDWVEMYEYLLLLVAWADLPHHAIIAQIFDSIIGEIRQIAIETGVYKSS